MLVSLMKFAYESNYLDFCASMVYDISMIIKLEVVEWLCPMSFNQP